MKAAASSWRTWMNRTLSCRLRSDSMIPLMPSPGSPKITSTPQSRTVSIRISAAVSAMTNSPVVVKSDESGIEAAAFSFESSSSFPSMTTIEHLLQHQRFVVLLVLRAIYQSDRSLFALLLQHVDGLFVRAQFFPVPHLEFLPPGRVM